MNTNCKYRANIPVVKTLVRGMLFVVIVSFFERTTFAQSAFRRATSPQQPMWQVHIDVWNNADPQAIIDLIPEDIKPYVVMNVSMSINHNASTGKWLSSEYGYETSKSWVRTCAENRMWCMVQQSSGGLHHFPENDLSIYEEFYRDYPNFLGFNYAEQFWAFDAAGDIRSSKWVDRINLFAKLLELGNKYGGYLTVSWCGNQFDANINPLAMIKRNPIFEAACKKYSDNYIPCEKYTQGGYLQDMESLFLGVFLSGYSGQWGIRYDQTGWTGPDGSNGKFIMATGLSAHLEHIMLSGESVIDGPELIWQQDFRETGTAATSNGYSHRKWTTFPQFDNVSVDIYRKILDGTVRIPTRKEVVDRTKFVIINDVTSGSADDIYASPTTLFEGVYRMDGDGNLRDNHSFFKKTGRYPTIPTVYKLADDLANSFKVQIKKSAYASKWSSINTKVTELDAEFPQEYTGTIYAGRHENGWVIYNPFKDGKTATGNIPFKYNTCGSMDITFQLYSAGVIKETADKVTFYLNNYDNVLNTGLKTDEIKINGCSSQPTYTFKDRANHAASNVISSYSDGTLTLTIKHNGALDLTVNCSGAATGRLTKFTEAKLIKPELPPVYIGPRQYEAENWEYKSINRITPNGTGSSIRNYQGLGYMNFGTNASAAVRATVNALYTGKFTLQTRYTITGTDVSTVDLYVNDSKIASPSFTKTPTLGDWRIKTQEITLKAGVNTIEFKATAALASALYFDNIILINDSSKIANVQNPKNDSQKQSKSGYNIKVLEKKPAIRVITQGPQGEDVNIAMYNIDGKKVFQKYVRANTEIRVNNGNTISAGVYYIVLTAKGKTRVISPVFKM